MEWASSFRVEPLPFGVQIIEDRNLVDYIEDWSKVRSPSRARRRRKRGFQQNISMLAVPQKTVYSMEHGCKLVMHPEVARAFERQLAKQIEDDMQRALLGGSRF